LKNSDKIKLVLTVLFIHWNLFSIELYAATKQ